MIGFHIDMNIAQFQGPYLKRWLKELARLGYDTILWEVENNIAWESCPESVSPDAFSKKEFRQILDYSRKLGLEPIPLFQTIGHCEYVLMHKKFKHLSEDPGRIDQYCPQNRDVVPFLLPWIREYMDLFGKIRYFHIGADEAWSLGSCPKCKAFAKKHSLSQLFIDHVNKVAAPIVRQGVTPIIWADMVLKHPEALSKLSRKIMLFDWQYGIHRGDGIVQVWGQGRVHKDKLDAQVIQRFGEFLFPEGNEPGRDVETFYTADYLTHNGFRVVTCPGSASGGDSVFTPRNWYHMVNTFDSFHKGMGPGLDGSVLTSWTVRVHPWEVQLSSIDLPGYIKKNPKASLEAYQKHFLQSRFGTQDPRFWKACGLLSKTCQFTTSQALGIGKAALPKPKTQIATRIRHLVKEGLLDKELANAEALLPEYREGYRLLRQFRKKAGKGQAILDIWDWSARSLINRAETAIFLLRRRKGLPAQGARRLLADMRKLRRETETLFAEIYKPTRCREMMEWMYDSLDYELSQALKPKSSRRHHR